MDFENMKLLLVLNRVSHSFALITREIPWSTLKINFVFLHIHVLLSICYSVPDAMGSLSVVVHPKKNSFIRNEDTRLECRNQCSDKQCLIFLLI